MDLENPYASPGAASHDLETPRAPYEGATGRVVRDRNDVIVPNESTLPDACPRCGETADGKVRRMKVAWSPPWVNLSAGAITFAAVFVLRLTGAKWSWYWALAASAPLTIWLERKFKQRGAVYFRYCVRHERRRKRFLVAAIAFGALTVISFCGVAVLSAVSPTGDLDTYRGVCAIMGGVSMLAGLVSLLGVQQPFQVRRMTKGYVWLKDSDDRFRALIPEATPGELAWLEVAPTRPD